MQLSWALIIATYQRRDILCICLRLAMRQTRLPSEIIVIDASPDWSTTRDYVMNEIAGESQSIEWRYCAADFRSTASQRNQGLELANSDVVFLIDDDSFMFPTCAEEIMKAYDADKEQLIGGIQANPIAGIPEGVLVSGERKRTGNIEFQPRSRLLVRVRDWVRRNILLMDAAKLFIPYNGAFHVSAIPQSCAHLKLVPVPLFQGYLMTFRREAILRAGFEPAFREYAAGEDLDASYRVSLEGGLFSSTTGNLHHFNSASGRLSRTAATAKSVANLAYLLRKHSSNIGSSKRQFYILMLRRLVAELIKDSLSRRWSMPQVRGILVGLLSSIRILNFDEEQVREWKG
jgi:GT2 family glycosyltransferase